MLIVSATLIILTVSILLRQTIISAVAELCSSLLKTIRYKINISYKKNESKISRMATRQKEKSLVYKTHVFLRELVFDLGLDTISPAGFITFLLFMSVFANVILLIFIRSLIGFLLGIPILMGLSLLLIYVFTRSSHYNRIRKLMEAENFLCTTISNGIVKSVTLNLSKLPMEFRPVFNTFLEEQRMRNTVYAIRELNNRLGTQFDDFCRKVEIFETQHPVGYERVFQFNIQKNTRAMKLISIKKARSKNSVLDGVVSICILLAALLFMPSVMPGMWAFYATTGGKVFIATYITVALSLLLRIQVLLNREV